MQLEVGKVVNGVVTGITKFGAFVDIGEGKTGLVHISEISTQYVNDVSEFLQNGQQVKVKILGVNDNGKLNLSIRKAEEPERMQRPQQRNNYTPRDKAPSSRGSQNRESAQNSQPAGFEDMLSKFMHSSDEKLSGMRKQPQNRRGAYQKKGSYNK